MITPVLQKSQDSGMQLFSSGADTDSEEECLSMVGKSTWLQMNAVGKLIFESAIWIETGASFDFQTS